MMREKHRPPENGCPQPPQVLRYVEPCSKEELSGMKKLLVILLTIGLSFTLSAVTFAQEAGTKTPVINKRQRIQRHRVRQGVRSGELTAKETRRLGKEQREIRQDKKEAKSDGTVTLDERKDILKDQNKASRHVYRAKHNRRARN
jgi:hypothetical protein